MKRSTYKAFTLIEMLIVMGILVILMVVGVAAGRFAIDRANQIAHQNGATQLYQALQSHFTDYGKFPVGGTNSLETMTKDTSGEINTLGKYLDMGSFKGGAEATYFYFVNETKQATVVCVTLGGYEDATDKGISCVGNGFNDDTLGDGGAINQLEITKEVLDPEADVTLYEAILGWGDSSDWDGKTWLSVSIE